MKKPKKKKRRGKSKGRNRASKRYFDTHHLLWPRHGWGNGWPKKIREHWYMKIKIPMNTLHRQIHHDIHGIPVPNAWSIKDALRQLEMLEKFDAIHDYDNIERRLLVLMALFECSEPETYKALKAQYDLVCKFYKKTPH